MTMHYKMDTPVYWLYAPIEHRGSLSGMHQFSCAETQGHHVTLCFRSSGFCRVKYFNVHHEEYLRDDRFQESLFCVQQSTKEYAQKLFDSLEKA